MAIDVTEERTGFPGKALSYGLLVLVLVAFGALYARTLGSYGMFMWDEAEYASIARSLVRGEGYTINGEPELMRPPVLPVGGALAILAGGKTDDVVVKRATIAFALLALLVVYAAAARAYDPCAGLVAAVLLGFMPWFWTVTASFLSEIPFLTFFTIAIVGLYHGCYTAPRYFYLAWLGFGLALLTRYTAVIFGPMAGGIVLAALLTRDPSVRSRLFGRHMVLAPLVAVALLVPWFIRQQMVFGDVWIGLKKAVSGPLVHQPGVSMPWHFYLGELEPMLSVTTLILTGLGAAAVCYRRDRFGLHCLGVAVGIFIWFSFYRWKEPRFVSSVLPLLALVAAGGLSPLIAPFGKWRLAVPGVLAVLLFTIHEPDVRLQFEHQYTLGYPSFLEAMAWLREHSTREAVVMGANHPQICWYGERRVIDFPEREQLKPLLGQTEWVLMTNFERGQKPYVRELSSLLTLDDFRRGTAVEFRGGQWVTVLVRASVLRERL